LRGGWEWIRDQTILNQIQAWSIDNWRWENHDTGPKHLIELAGDSWLLYRNGEMRGELLSDFDSETHFSYICTENPRFQCLASIHNASLFGMEKYFVWIEF
jgi:hypothetical protein